jgi:modulator of FtsH protease
MCKYPAVQTTLTGETMNPNMTPDIGNLGGDLAESRNRVLRNTYMLLGISMIPTVLGAWLGVTFGFTWFKGSPLIGMAVFLVGAMGFMFAIEKFKDSSIGVALLLAFTFFMGLMLSRLIGSVMGLKNGADLIMLAFGGTAMIFVGMATIASTIKRDLSNMGKFLFIGMIVLLVLSVGAIVFKSPALMLAVTGMVLVLFSLYLMYDLNQIMQGNETNYVTATLSVYLSVYNIFSSLLSLLGIFGGDKD